MAGSVRCNKEVDISKVYHEKKWLKKFNMIHFVVCRVARQLPREDNESLPLGGRCPQGGRGSVRMHHQSCIDHQLSLRRFYIAKLSEETNSKADIVPVGYRRVAVLLAMTNLKPARRVAALLAMTISRHCEPFCHEMHT